MKEAFIVTHKYIPNNDTSYITLSHGIFEEMHEKKPKEKYFRTIFNTSTKKIEKFENADTLYNKYYFDPVAFALNVNPTSLSPASISPYAAFGNNPILHIDDDGKWPTDVHNEILDKAFGKNLDIKVLDALKLGSKNADALANQTGAKQYIHGMLPSGKNPSTGKEWTKQEAIAATDKFIEDKVNAFVQTGDYEQLGEALHPLMDITSPSHRDEKGNPLEFDWFSGHSHKEAPDRIKKENGKNGYITEKDMRNRIDNIAVKAVQTKYKEAVEKRQTFEKKQDEEIEQFIENDRK